MCGGLMLECRNSPLPVGGVMSAMQQADHSPVPCSFEILRLQYQKEKSCSASWGFQASSLVSKHLQNPHYRHPSVYLGENFHQPIGLHLCFQCHSAQCALPLGEEGQVYYSVLELWADFQFCWIWICTVLFILSMSNLNKPVPNNQLC